MFLDFGLSWATATIFALLVLDVSTEIGVYRTDLEEASSNWEGDRLRLGKRAITYSSFISIIIATTFLVVSGLSISYLTYGMDWRMESILEGLSRIEGALVLYYISAQTPCWVGLYASSKNKRRNHQFSDLRSVRFHVAWSVLQQFGRVYFLLLPFVGHPISLFVGIGWGFIIDSCLYIARRTPYNDGMTNRRKAVITYSLASLLAVSSSLLFASGCHYIQTVWDIRYITSEWGLATSAFFIWLAINLVTHFCFWKDTKVKILEDKRFSTHEKKSKLAMSIWFDIRNEHLDGTNIKDTDSDNGSDDLDGEDITSRINPVFLSPPSYEEENSSSVGALCRQRCCRICGLDAARKDELQEVEKEEEPGFHIGFLCNFDVGFESIMRAILGVACILSIFIVIVNIGATMQINVVKINFPSVHKLFYENMDDGPVCALQNGTRNVVTFDDKDAAHDAGYLIVHCGACGACSNWHNLRLEFTTREYLATESAACGRKVLTPGGRDAVSQCLQGPKIGFQDECAECWTDDISCAREHCAFIFLQSILINKMSNFKVSADAITSATCEEAMCEKEFVPCSGANRRRMDVTSMIERPHTERCTIVDVDWYELFGDDSPSSLPTATTTAELLGSPNTFMAGKTSNTKVTTILKSSIILLLLSVGVLYHGRRRRALTSTDHLQIEATRLLSTRQSSYQ